MVMNVRYIQTYLIIPAHSFSGGRVRWNGSHFPGSSFGCWESPEVRSAAWGRGGSSGISYLSSGTVDLLIYYSSPESRLIWVSYQCVCDLQESMSFLNAQQTALENIRKLGEEILSSCHPDSVITIKSWISITKTRYEEVSRVRLISD